jgi:DNA-binding response OmpR family regulator
LNVSKPRNAAHETVARKILETPDTLLTLVLAGDHLPEGMAALQAGLSNSVLRPHYAAIEARRLARRFRDRPADIVAAAAHLDESTVLTPSEIQRLALLVRNTPNVASRTEIMQRIKGVASRVTFGRNLMRFLDDD